MRASSLSAVVLGIFVTAFLAVPGCGGDDPPPKEEKKGDSTVCDGLQCDPIILPGDYPPIPACCPSGGGCGLDGTQFEQYGAHFEERCQARDQPGEEDSECPSSTPVPTDFGDLDFPGCCTPAGRCGYLVDQAFHLVELGLGCVDAAPFLDGGVPKNCTPGPAGAGGAGGGGGQ